MISGGRLVFCSESPEKICILSACPTVDQTIGYELRLIAINEILAPSEIQPGELHVTINRGLGLSIRYRLLSIEVLALEKVSCART